MKRQIRILIAFLSIVLMFSVASAFAATDECEPNDSKQKANAITMGCTVYCSSDPSGADWFEFKAPISGTAIITMKMDFDYSGINWGLDATADVYDSNSNEIAEVYDDLSTDGGSTIQFGVVAGRTYYVRCWGDNCGFYQNGIDYHFKIGYYIGKTSISKVKGKKRSIAVKWNRKAGATYYQLQYIRKSTYRDYGWIKAKTVKVSQNSKTIKGMVRKKRYYVRVRGIRKICGITYYSGWSSRKCVRTK